MFHGKIWKAAEFGAARDVLRQETTTWAAPAEGRLLVKMAACGAGFPDGLITAGKFPGISKPPAIPGQEVAGEVVAVAAGSGFTIGDRVMGITPFFESLGGLSEYAYVDDHRARRIPSPLSEEEAAGFLIGFKTAHNGLIDRGNLKSGEVLLVLGAAGGSGVTAIQLGKALGATVIAAASSDEKLEYCKTIGADHTVNYRTADLADEVRRLTDGRGADVVYDPVGGDIGTQALKAVARLGRFAVIGYASGSWPHIDPLHLLLGNYSVVGVFGGNFTREEDAAALDRLCELASQGVIRTPIGRVYTFDQAPDAIHDVAESRTIGKSVVRVA